MVLQQGRAQSIIIERQNQPAILLIGTYAHQRAIATCKAKNSKQKLPQALKQHIDSQINTYLYSHKNGSVILLGDLQHTLPNALHRIGKLLSPPPHNLLDHAMQRHNLISAIPYLAPTEPYLTRQGTQGAAGLDHIMVSQQLLTQTTHYGIDIAQTTHRIASDHRLIYIDITHPITSNSPLTHITTTYQPLT